MTSPCRALEPLSPEVFFKVRSRTIFHACKWDPQVEDSSVLAPFPLVLSAEAWRDLAECAEQLAAETEAAEMELRARPDLWRKLGVPWQIRRALAKVSCREPGLSLRVVRFDFHLTTNGWRISEANTDVPGGFNEASGFTELMSSFYPGFGTCGDPAVALAKAIRRLLIGPATVALVHATAYSDDRQVMVYLGRKLEREGVQAALVSPEHIGWVDSEPRIATSWHCGPVDLLFRFYPAEWLPSLRRTCAWEHFFDCPTVPLCNPATALLTQSKRFPLVWDDLATPLPAWRRLLPETRDPRHVPWRSDGSWVLKPVFGRVGDGIGMVKVTPEKEWKRIRRSVRFFPGSWAAQRRFESIPLETTAGPVYPCIGVYTVQGKVAGVYGRISPTPIINHLAQEVAVLMEPAVGRSDAAFQTPAELPRHMICA